MQLSARRPIAGSPVPAAAAGCYHYDPLVKPEIRLVAIDLDGTLLDDTRQVSRQTADALCCLPARGVKVVLASARPPRSVRAVYHHLRLDTLQINYNGALIWHEPTRTVVDHRPIAGIDALRIVAAARAMHPSLLASAEILDRWYTDRVDEAYLTQTARLFAPDVVGPLDVIAEMAVSKLMLAGPPDMIDDAERLTRSDFAQTVQTIRQEPDLLQLAHPESGKGPALGRVADYYGIAMSQTLAIGDAPNDIEMIRAAGVGVAMDNAHPQVKAAATWTAPSNNDHGVHAALRRYGLCD